MALKVSGYHGGYDNAQRCALSFSVLSAGRRPVKQCFQ